MVADVDEPLTDEGAGPAGALRRRDRQRRLRQRRPGGPGGRRARRRVGDDPRRAPTRPRAPSCPAAAGSAPRSPPATSTATRIPTSSSARPTATASSTSSSAAATASSATARARSSHRQAPPGASGASSPSATSTTTVWPTSSRPAASSSSYCLGGDGGPQSCEPLGGELDHPVTALAVGDVTGDGFGDIVQGIPDGGDDVPDEPDTGELGPPGLLQLWRGGQDAPADEPILITQDTAGVRGNDQAEDRFGAALAVGDLDGDEFADMVVGAPGEDGEFGRITVDPRRRAGPRRRGRLRLQQQAPICR